MKITVTATQSLDLFSFLPAFSLYSWFHPLSWLLIPTFHFSLDVSSETQVLMFGCQSTSPLMFSAHLKLVMYKTGLEQLSQILHQLVFLFQLMSPLSFLLSWRWSWHSFFHVSHLSHQQILIYSWIYSKFNDFSLPSLPPLGLRHHYVLTKLLLCLLYGLFATTIASIPQSVTSTEGKKSIKNRLRRAK